MVRRCTNKAARDYDRYGGRGVVVCELWLNDPAEFYCHAVTLAGWDQPGLELDRIDNTRGYEPGNVQMKTPSQNMRNRRNTTWVVYNGRRLSVSDFRELHCPNLTRSVVTHRVKAGVSAEEIVAEANRRE